MNLQEALSQPGPRALYAAIVEEQIAVATGGHGIQEATAWLPPRPRDGSLLDRLMAPEMLERLRGMARGHVTSAMGRAKNAKLAEVSREKAAERARRRIAQTRGRKPMTMTHSARQFMEGRQAMIDGAPVPEPRTSMAILEAVMPSRARTEPVVEPELADDEPAVQGNRVRDLHTGQIVEAAVAAVPPAHRGWREQMALKGCSSVTIEALEGAR
jgi:hypothetical protein